MVLAGELTFRKALFASTLLVSAALSPARSQTSADPSAQDFARTLGMDSSRVLGEANGALLRQALARQELREAVPKDLRDYYKYLERNPLLALLKSNPDVGMFHVLLWNHFALDMTSLDHTTKNERDPAHPGIPVIEPSYAEQFGPARSSRAMAIVHLAMFEAVNAIDPRYASYKASGTTTDIRTQIVSDLAQRKDDLSRASVASAVAYAAYESLKTLYPSKTSILDADIEQASILIRLAQPDDGYVDLGRQIGRLAASKVVSLRSADNSQVPGTNSVASKGPCTQPMHSTCLEARFASSNPDPGGTFAWQPDLTRPLLWQPDPVVPVGTRLGETWGEVVPFVTRPGQFIGTNASGRKYLVVGAGPGSRTTAPVDTDSDFQEGLTKAAYGSTRPDPRLGRKRRLPVYNKYGVRHFGRASTPDRDPDLTARGLFWGYDGTALLCAPPRLYNMVATSVALSRQDHEAKTALGMARYLALVNLALADAAIAAWDGKYAFQIARPVTYIRYKDPGSVHEGGIDAAWTPLGQASTNGAQPNLTPAFPAYPSGHAVFGGALFQLMSRYYGLPKNDPRTRFSFVSDEYNGVNHGQDGVARQRQEVTFRSFEAAEWENAESRIWLGIHWQRDADDGVALGNLVGDAVFANALRRLQPS